MNVYEESFYYDYKMCKYCNNMSSCYDNRDDEGNHLECVEKSKKVNNLNNKKMVTILNTSILTSYGSFNYEPLTLEEAKDLIKEGFESAVGHQSTCDILSSLLEQEVNLNRVQYTQKEEDVALVFKLKGRPEEGKILSVSEIEAIGYEFGKLTRIM